jgi:hypothetical protein
MLQRVGSSEYGHPAITQPVATAPKDPLVIVRPGQACPPWETRRAAAQGNDSDRQAGPALCTTRIDHTTAVLGAHTGTKTVGPLALQVTGLIGSFHGTSLVSTGCTLESRLTGAKGRKEYSSRRIHVNINTTQSYRNRVWITFHDGYRLPILQQSVNKKL